MKMSVIHIKLLSNDSDEMRCVAFELIHSLEHVCNDNRFILLSVFINNFQSVVD